MRLCATAGSDDPDARGFLPPTPPGGERFAAARLIETADFADERLIFGLMFFDWQTYVITPAGQDAVARRPRPGTSCSWAWRRTSQGAIDPAGARSDWHPPYPPLHPLAYLSGRICSQNQARVLYSPDVK